MSIVSEIQRLQNDSSAIASAIAAKGVTVPSGSGFDDYAGLIGQISGGGSVLPYTPLEYIQTDGTAYINSNVLAKSPALFDVKVKMNASISSSEVIVGEGATDGHANTLVGLWRSVNNQSKIGYGLYYLYGGRIEVTEGFSQPIEVSSALFNGTCLIGYKASGSSSYTKATQSLTRTVNSSSPFFIFATNVGNSPTWTASSGTRIYYIKIATGASCPTIAFDGVPALYNGEYGLWDRVTNSFFGNAAGSGSFTGA